jgi:hypothetical protein
MNLKLAICAVIEHSRIIDSFLGYQDCGRCGTRVGDTLGGVGAGLVVAIGHGCDKCRANYQLMTWKDKFLVPDPFRNTK